MRPIVLIGLLGVVGASAQAQTRLPARGAARPTAAAPDCRACHTAVTPTKNAPALAACPRLKVTGYHPLTEAPATLTLGSAEGTYGPVTFAHREHAHMAETGKGCSGCHHYDQARPIQKCKNCHAVSRSREDLAKPDLKAAMHRQCISCHRDWNPGGACKTCHVTGTKTPAVGAAPAATAPAATAPAATTPAAKKAATVTAPERVIYETGAKAGKTVTFFHADHTTRFALACADCHQQESCRTCHDRKRVGAQGAVLTRRTAPGLSETQAHVRCATCHTTDACATCHKGMPSRSLDFDHGRRSGFTLNQFHAVLPCKSCHTAPGAYARVNADWESCHKGWQKTFAHARTGIALDDQHKDVECSGCHEDKTFRAAPTCAGCHDDKKWPAQKPGKVTTRRGAGK
jgi:hypothetical protein